MVLIRCLGDGGEGRRARIAQGPLSLRERDRERG